MGSLTLGTSSMKPGLEQTTADSPRQGVWTLSDAARSKSIRARLGKTSQSQRQEEQMSDLDQLVQAALEEIPEGRRSMVRVFAGACSWLNQRNKCQHATDAYAAKARPMAFGISGGPIVD